MRLILDRYRDEYRTALKGEKAKLVRKIHGELVARGMKFMKQVNGGAAWVEVDLDAAIQKVGHSLRNPKYRNKPTTPKSGQSPAPHRVPSSTSAFDMVRPPPEPTSMDSSIATGQELPRTMDGISSSLESDCLQTRYLPRHVVAPAQQNTVGSGGQNLAHILQNQLVEIELERLRSALPIPIAPPSTVGLLPLYSTNQVYDIAEQDALLSLANGSWQNNPVPDDPMLWICIAAASLSNTGLY